MIEEDHLIAEPTGNPPVADTEVMPAAWRGRESEARQLIDAAAREAVARGLGQLAGFASCSSSVLYNGLGRPDLARDARGRPLSAASSGTGRWWSASWPRRPREPAATSRPPGPPGTG